MQIFFNNKKSYNILDFDSCIITSLKNVANDRDLIFATCVQKGIFHLGQHYDFKVFRHYNAEEIIVVACKQEYREFCIAEFLLAFGFEKQYLQNVMFCFKTSLIVFYDGKILHIQKYNDFTDIFSALQYTQEMYQIEIETIYCNQEYQSLKDRQKHFDTICKNGDFYQNVQSCFKNNKDLFFSPPLKFFQTSFFKVICFFVLFIVALQVISTMLEKRFVKSQNLAKTIQTPPLDSYEPRYLLIAKIFQITAQSKLFIESIDFKTKDGDSFVLRLHACASNQKTFLTWAKKIGDLLKTSKFDYEKLQKDNTHYCVLATWGKE